MGNPQIHVGIQSGKFILFKLNGNFTDEQGMRFPEGSYVARVENEGIKLEVVGKTITAGNLCLRPDLIPAASFAIANVTIGVNFHWEKKEEQVFRGSLCLVKDGDDMIVINILPVEQYLMSVISSEMSATSSLELLKAHAVISRGWALAQIEKRGILQTRIAKYSSTSITEQEITRWYDREDHQLFDICADDHCQRYHGISRATTPMVGEAVKQTEGEVLTYDGMLCDTRFSKCCGGKTELFENSWEPIHHPYLQSIYDCTADKARKDYNLSNEEDATAWIMKKPKSYCNTADQKILTQVLNDYDQSTHDFFRWKLSYGAAELGELIKKRTGIDFGTILDLIPVQRGASGRIVRLKISGSRKTMIIGKELEIRKALSNSHLHSSAFVVAKEEDSNGLIFTLFGAGWGHGVGLCQIGAAVMGAKGFSYTEILKHYYKGAELEKRY
jgi:stage II sporulation protein D